MLDGNTSAATVAREAPGTRADASASHVRAATNDLVWKLFRGQRVGPLTLRDFIEAQYDAHELLSRIVLARDVEDRGEQCRNVDDELERRLRAHLKDSQPVAERAAELAREAA